MASPLKKLLYPAARQLYNLPVVKPVVAPAWQSLYRFYRGMPASDSEKARMQTYAPPLPADPRYFLITSCGHNGSLWLAKMLHRHPDIMCSCGYDPPPVSLDYVDNTEETAIIRSAYRTPADFKYGCNKSTRFIEAYKDIEAQIPPRTPKQHRFLLEELEALPRIKNHKLIGSVHSVHASEVWEMAKQGNDALGGRFPYTTFIDFVRHPIMRLDTVIHHVVIHILPRTPKEAFAPFHDIMRRFEKEKGADFSDPIQLAYIQAEYVQNTTLGLMEDATVLPQYPRIIFERLRNDPDYFGWLVSYISGGKITAEKDYLDMVYSQENMSSGRITGRKNRIETPRDAFAAWPRWIQEDFARICEENAVRERYRIYGYDLSFVK